MARIFVALPISPDLQEKIASWRKDFPNFPVRWLEGKNLHLTLVPPWESQNPKAEASRLSQVKDMSGFETVFEKVEFGPTQNSPRLIWATGHTPPELLTLKNSIFQALKFSPEKRKFLTHLTLARFRTEDFWEFAIQTLNEKVEWRERFSSFVLMQSRLKPSGADYEILQTFPFA